MVNVIDITIPPNNIEAEQGVLCSIFMDRTLMKECINHNLENTDFFTEAHNLIYRAMTKLYKENKEIDAITVIGVLKDNNRLDNVGGKDYIRDINTFLLSTSGFKEYLDIVLEKSKLRKLDSLRNTMDILISNDTPTDDIKSRIMLGLDELKTKTSTNENFTHITYKDKISRAYAELVDTNPKDIMKFGRDVWDKTLGGIYGGKIYVIGADTGVGKTTYVNQICNNVSKQGYRVVKYALEDRMEDIGKEEIFYLVNRMRRTDGKKPYGRIEFVNNEVNTDEFANYVNKASTELLEMNIIELDKKKQISIDELILLMEEECEKGTKLFAIDHLHYFEMDTGNNKSRHDLQIQNAMHRLNELARKYNVAIMLVAHYKMNKAFGQLDLPSYDDFKDGAAIKQVANVIIQITRDINEGGESSFYITKLRGPLKPTIIKSNFNMSMFEYNFVEEGYKPKDDGQMAF